MRETAHTFEIGTRPPARTIAASSFCNCSVFEPTQRAAQARETKDSTRTGSPPNRVELGDHREGSGSVATDAPQSSDSAATSQRLPWFQKAAPITSASGAPGKENGGSAP